MDGSLTINGPKRMETTPFEKKDQPFRPIEHVDARLLSVLDVAADSICLIDEQSRILVFNKASEALFGYSADEVIGKSVEILMPSQYAKHHGGWVQRYLHTGEHSIIGIGREVQGQHKDGSTFPFDLSVGVANTEDGRQFIGVMRDLRGRKKDEQRLRSLQTELNQLTRINAMDEMGATVAHELNQPLTAIILYLQAIEKKLRSSDVSTSLGVEHVDKLVELCNRAVQEAQRSASLLQRIRSIIEKQEPERSQCDMVEIIRQAHKLALVGFAATDVHVQMNATKDLPPVWVDPVQIEQIVLNLIRNAFQALKNSDPKAIEIRFSVEPEGTDLRQRLVVQFEDTGPGILPDMRANLFKAFSSDRSNGMGLGLAIARSIAQNHGGSLELAPYDATKPGACFILSLPIASPSFEDGTDDPDRSSISVGGNE